MSVDSIAWVKINRLGPLGNNADFLLQVMSVDSDAWVKINDQGPVGDNAEFLLQAMAIAPRAWDCINETGPWATMPNFVESCALAPAWVRINRKGPLGNDAEFLLKAMAVDSGTWVKINSEGPLGNNAEFLLKAMAHSALEEDKREGAFGQQCRILLKAWN